MKLDKIYGLFRKSKKIILYNKFVKDPEERIAKQYISDGVCIYALDNLPIFNEATISGLLGCSSDEIKVDAFAENDFIRTVMSEADNSTDIPLKINPFVFFDHTVMSSLFEDDEQILTFVDTKYIKPFADDGNITFLSRNIDGRRIIIIKNGFFVVAAIIPVIFVGATLDNCIRITEDVYKELMDYKLREEKA